MKVLLALLVCCVPAFGQVTINVYNNSPPARSAYTVPPPMVYGSGCRGSSAMYSNGCTGGGMSSVAIYSGSGWGSGRMMSTGCTGGGRMMMASGCTGGQGGITYYGSVNSQPMINYSPAPAPSYFGVYASSAPAPVYGVPVRANGPAMYISGQAPYGARIGSGQWATPSGDPPAPGWFGVPGARFPADGPIRRGFRAMFGFDSGRG